MAKGHRSQIKRERNAVKDTRPSAKLSYARISVQKACFVLDAIRGKDVQTALGILMYNPRYASSVIEKLLKSAIANAENNNGMSAENLYIAECYANKGPTMKRIRPRAQGRAYRIEKRIKKTGQRCSVSSREHRITVREPCFLPSCNEILHGQNNESRSIRNQNILLRSSWRS